MNTPDHHEGITRRGFLEASALAAAGLTLATPAGAAKIASVVQPSAPPAGTWPLVPFAAGKPEYLSDLRVAGPASAFANEWDSTHWRVVPFESRDAKGMMIVSGQNVRCPELKLRLPFKGWHAVYIGLTSNENYSRLEARLGGDPAFSLFTDHALTSRMEYERGWGHYSTRHIQNYFWKHADLTDQDLILRQVRVFMDPQNPDAPQNLQHAGWTAYIKVVPMSPVEVTNLEKDRKRSDTRRLIATHDVTTCAAWLSYTSADDIRREMEPFRNTDFFRMDWEGGKGDITHYPSKIGRMVTFDWQKEQYHSFEHLISQSFKLLQKKGIDPFRVALDHAHNMGMEFHASYRVSGFLYPPPRDERNTGGIFWQHPEWRGLGQDGRPTPRISYAYPEVRAWVVSLLREMAAYPIDGVTILYNRRPPVLEYEMPLIDSFQKKYGQDPRKLDESDPRWLAHRATFVTAFMKDVRKAMDEISERSGRKKRLQVSAVVMSSEERNNYFGLDLKTWAKEGIVDWIIPYQSGLDLLSTRDSFANPGDLDYFVKLAKGTSCRVAPNLLPREIPPTTYMERAAALYQEGAHALYFWDTFNRSDYSDSWSALRRLGHRDEVDAWVKAGQPGTLSQRDPLKMLGNWDMSYDAAS